MRKRRQAGPRQKPVTYELIKPESDAGNSLYPKLNLLIEKWHEELTNARIALAWNLSWKPDVDGRVTLGKCKKASDLDRELAEFDFAIVLRKEFFEDVAVNDAQRIALLDHELCHAAPKLDPETGGAATQFYSASAIYAITPTTEATARAVARGARPVPVNRWELPEASEDE